MSRSRKAAITSLFVYCQFLISIITGVILFPLVIRSVGAHDYGLWLASGEAIGFLLLGDLGVFTVLPWMIATCVGSEDFETLRKHFSNAIAIGCVLGGLLIAICIFLLCLPVGTLLVSSETWEITLLPVATLLCLNGLGYPLRAFNATLVGLQDVFFGGCLMVGQTLLTITLLVSVIFFHHGLVGLAIVAGLPPLITSCVAAVRVTLSHNYVVRGIGWPDLRGCISLFREGFGSWLGGLGVRIMVASNGIIFGSIGKPIFATIYVSTSKIPTMLTPICSTIPDSGLIGLAQVFGGGEAAELKRSAICLTILYALIPSFACIGLLSANPAFVKWWIGDEFFAGYYVNSIFSLSLLLAGTVGGLVKLAATVGYRQTVGLATIIAGISYAAIGYVMAQWRGLAGLAETTLIVWVVILLPVGCLLTRKIFGLNLSDFIAIGVLRWIGSTFLIFSIACWCGIIFSEQPGFAFLSSFVCIVLYFALMQSVIKLAPWPLVVRDWLSRLRLI